VEALRGERERVGRYPDEACRSLRDALARHHRVEPDMVLVGNGTHDILLAATRALVSHDRPAVLPTRTWPLYQWVVEECGTGVRWAETPAYDLVVDSLVEAMGDGFGCCFVCRPHNPCGTLLSAAGVRRLVAAAARVGGTVVVDEAYMEYVPDADGVALELIRAGAGCLLLKTFSKAYGLAGIRVAYAVGPARLVAALECHRPRFGVGQLGLTAAVAAVGDQPHVRRVSAENARVRDRTAHLLRSAGFGGPPSSASFLLVAVGVDSAGLSRRLLDTRAIDVVDAGHLGYPRHLRVSLGTAEEMESFCAAVREAVPAMAHPTATP